MRGISSKSIRRKGALERMEASLVKWRELKESGQQVEFRIKLAGITQPLSYEQKLDLKIKRVASLIEQTQNK